MSEIRLESGFKIRAFAPPNNFDPLTASDDALERNGFPPRPDDPRLLKRYRDTFSQLKNKFHYVPPMFRANTDRRHGVRLPKLEAGTETSPNWSGGVVYAPSGQSFK